MSDLNPPPPYAVLAKDRLDELAARSDVPHWVFLEVDYWVRDLAHNPRQEPARRLRTTSHGDEVWSVHLAELRISLSYIIFESGAFASAPWVWLRSPIRVF